MPRTTSPRRLAAAAALLVCAVGPAGCSSEKACTTSGGSSGVGISAVDGVTDAQGNSDVKATVCLDRTCRTVTLAGEPNQKATLVAGFVDLPLSSPDERTVHVTLTRGGAPAPGSPYDVQIHPVAAGATGTGPAGASTEPGCAPAAYVASILVDVLGVHEAPPPDAPAHT